jgi:hypothetical protein
MSAVTAAFAESGHGGRFRPAACCDTFELANAHNALAAPPCVGAAQNLDTDKIDGAEEKGRGQTASLEQRS